MLITGLHTVSATWLQEHQWVSRSGIMLADAVADAWSICSQVADIFCNVCNTNLGWKYEMAFEEGQKYKVGPGDPHLLLPVWTQPPAK